MFGKRGKGTHNFSFAFFPPSLPLLVLALQILAISIQDRYTVDLFQPQSVNSALQAKV